MILLAILVLRCSKSPGPLYERGTYAFDNQVNTNYNYPSLNYPFFQKVPWQRLSISAIIV
ncbi:hypothetical protein C7N43_26465 [Sphingobacteriales bacterium UPWRP_1]|nr:hypothetical protein B6N25_14105 [Sphingobacteriales bacterium TSM_CSS]PSJ73943.1 hypothetical protein C7N43_26465 [Sphingobacteriales bacterium UPWRP_1]